jgi:hypothetical protein
MPRVGFKPTIPAFKRTKTVHALDRATTLIGTAAITRGKITFKYVSFICQKCMKV